MRPSRNSKSNLAGEISSVVLWFVPGLVENPIKYTVSLGSDGAVEYDAKEGYGLSKAAMDAGRQISETSRIPKGKADSLFQLIRKSEFFELNETYDDETITDCPYYGLTVRLNSGTEKEVSVYGGSISEGKRLEASFHHIYRTMLQITDTKNWLAARFGNG
jgi:hypothetical protein